MATIKPGDIAFDELQNSSFDIATPLVVLHESKDGKWVYVKAPSTPGWVLKEKIVFCEYEDYKRLISAEPFCVVISGKADIFFDETMACHAGYMRMGSKLPFAREINASVVEAQIPVRDELGKYLIRSVYLNKRDVNIGYLPYTPRNIIEEAFKLLNAPYGWGGVYGEQDCSSYLKGVFATVGIALPRNSSQQAKAGRGMEGVLEIMDDEVKEKTISENGIGGITILAMKGHVLLYIGSYNGIAYAIHETHGYSEKYWWGYVTRSINKVVVSDLSLGGGGKRGSLISRIIAARIIE